MGEYEKALARLEIDLPETARQFYRRPHPLENLYPASVQDLARLTRLYPAAPARFLPLFGISCGDMLGLYFPWDGGEPFVVGFDHEESIMIPLSKDVVGFFKDPDAFCFNDPTEPRRSFWRRNQVVRPLLIRPLAKHPELELLKPFAFHYRALERKDPMFDRLIRRFGSPGPVAGLIRDTFSDVLSLHDRKRWMKLSKRLTGAGFVQEAIRALDNCHTLHFIYPTYGEPYRRNPPVTWKKVLEVLELLQPLVDTHGSGLDRASTAHRLRLAREFARGE